jgi:hypothetical protein
MSLVTVPYVFQPGTTIASAQVNANFAAITGVINGGLDGTNFSSVFTALNKSANGSGTIAGGLIFNWASPDTVPFDNSSSLAVTFDTPFPNAVLCIELTVQENTLGAHPNAVAAYVAGAPTLTNFALTAMGGNAGQVGTVFVLAIGY